MTTPEPVPLDIRFMNRLSSALLWVLACMLLAAALVWASSLSLFAIRGITVVNDLMPDTLVMSRVAVTPRPEVAHYNALTLKANVIARLQGTFFTLDLAQTRKVFETLPWVRRAVVRRVFPNRLKVQLQEHEAVAFWGAEGDSRLVNSYGEVFEASLADAESDSLPRLSGPEGQSAQALAMYLTLAPLLKPVDLKLVQLELSARGGWRAVLDSGTVLELGGGSNAELVARLERFLHTVTQATSRYNRRVEQLASVDLRHTDGYAIRLNGVSTLNGDEIKKR